MFKSWHATIISVFILGVSVYIAAHLNDQAGWVLVIILLLGMITIDPAKFAENLYAVGFPKS